MPETEAHCVTCPPCPAVSLLCQADHPNSVLRALDLGAAI